MPDGSTHQARQTRLPRVLRTISDFARVVTRMRLYASVIEDLDRKEKQKLKALEDEKQRVRERNSKKRERHKARIRSLTNKAYSFAQAHRTELLNTRSKTTSTLPDGNELNWGKGLEVVLPEDLDTFFTEMREKGAEVEDKYVRIKREPNRAALREKANADEVATFETVKRIEGPRISFKFPGLRRRVDAYIGPREELQNVAVIELRD